MCGGGNSLDITLRVGRIVPTVWVLMDIRVQAVERGFGHGPVNMFAEDGRCSLRPTRASSCGSAMTSAEPSSTLTTGAVSAEPWPMSATA